MVALETAAVSLTQLVAKSVGDGILSKVKAIKLQKIRMQWLMHMMQLSTI